MLTHAHTDISPKKNETKYGMAFEVILDIPKSATTPAKLTPHNTPSRMLTNEDIRNKLQKAEERRQVNNTFSHIYIHAYIALSIRCCNHV